MVNGQKFNQEIWAYLLCCFYEVVIFGLNCGCLIPRILFAERAASDEMNALRAQLHPIVLNQICGWPSEVTNRIFLNRKRKEKHTIHLNWCVLSSCYMRISTFEEKVVFTYDVISALMISRVVAVNIFFSCIWQILQQTVVASRRA